MRLSCIYVFHTSPYKDWKRVPLYPSPFEVAMYEKVNRTIHAILVNNTIGLTCSNIKDIQSWMFFSFFIREFNWVWEKWVVMTMSSQNSSNVTVVYWYSSHVWMHYTHIILTLGDPAFFVTTPCCNADVLKMTGNLITEVVLYCKAF